MPTEIEVKTILNKTKSRDPFFLDDYTVNPYSGCSFNCRYCYIRGSKYGEHLEMKTSIKVNAPQLLEKQLRLKAQKGQYGIIVLASATDPYLHFEEQQQLTRKLLKVIAFYRFPVHIITKSPLVERDFDILHEIDENAILPDDLKGRLDNGALITFSFSTIDDEIAVIFEPGAPKPSARLVALNNTTAAGFKAGISLMPLLPYITDTSEHLNKMFTTFKATNPHYIFPATITLFGNKPSDSKTLVLDAIKKNYPNLIEKYNTLFANSSQLPLHYNEAFAEKAKLLCEEFDIPNRIIK